MIMLKNPFLNLNKVHNDNDNDNDDHSDNDNDMIKCLVMYDNVDLPILMSEFSDGGNGEVEIDDDDDESMTGTGGDDFKMIASLSLSLHFLSL